MKENVYDISKLTFHPEKIRALAEGKITAPISARIKPTNKCDHKCFYCAYTPGNGCSVSETINMKDEIPKVKLLEVLTDFSEMGVKAVTYSGGGEPLIYPDISEAMRKTLDLGIDLSIITNGQKLCGEKAEILKDAKWVRISASENNAQLFSETRKRPASWFYELQDNIRQFALHKSSECELGINYVVNKKNSKEVYNSVKYFMELGVNHIKFTPLCNADFREYHKDIKEDVLSQIEKARKDFSGPNFVVYDTYKNDFELTGLYDRKYPVCYFKQVVPVIAADSKVYFCHDKTYNKQGILGDLKNMSFKELWFSKDTEKRFKEFDPRKYCQHHCTYDSRNILTERIINDLDNLQTYQPESNKHKNFV
jgi:MoaA/NifB/PqqE/SkfB family radical SAM enzyme